MADNRIYDIVVYRAGEGEHQDHEVHLTTTSIRLEEDGTLNFSHQIFGASRRASFTVNRLTKT